MARESVIVPLSEPVQAHGETVTKLTIRPPRGDDVAACGYPVRLYGDGENAGVEPQPAAIAQYISRLGGVPLSTVRALPLEDWQACMGAVMGFFQPAAAPTSLNGTSILPGSGEPAPATSSLSTSTNS